MVYENAGNTDIRNSIVLTLEKLIKRDDLMLQNI